MTQIEKLNDLRRKVLNNEPVDESEYAQIVRAMVADRVSAIEAPLPKARAKSTKATVSLDDLI